jgi:hypothetical protein
MRLIEMSLRMEDITRSPHVRSFQRLHHHDGKAAARDYTLATPCAASACKGGVARPTMMFTGIGTASTRTRNQSDVRQDRASEGPSAPAAAYARARSIASTSHTHRHAVPAVAGRRPSVRALMKNRYAHCIGRLPNTSESRSL